MTKIKRNVRKIGLMIFPIQIVIPLGFKEKNSTMAKKTAEKRSRAVPSDIELPINGKTPVVNDVVAHLGIAKKGPMVK